jgi:flagellar motility protein MotE (MotC chaperone)
MRSTPGRPLNSQSKHRLRFIPITHLSNIQRPIMAPPPTNETKLADAKKVEKSDPAKAEAIYKDILSKAPGSNEAALRDYESALIGLGELYRDNKKAQELAKLVETSRGTLSSFAKAKTAKLGEFQEYYAQVHR